MDKLRRFIPVYGGKRGKAHYEDFDPSGVRATWFVDPPYQEMGVHYKKGAGAIDFEALGAWCRSLPGQVIVCENEGATWLPFEALYELKGGAAKRTRTEVVWKNEKTAATLPPDGWKSP